MRGREVSGRMPGERHAGQTEPPPQHAHLLCAPTTHMPIRRVNGFRLWWTYSPARHKILGLRRTHAQKRGKE